MNWRKGCLYPVNGVHSIQVLAAIVGCQVESLPTTYLGSKYKAQENWRGFLERCERRLATWKSRYLSLGGRMVLVNSVLDALPTYVMSLFPLPVEVRDRFDALRRHLIWQGNRDKRKIHLINCDYQQKGRGHGP